MVFSRKSILTHTGIKSSRMLSSNQMVNITGLNGMVRIASVFGGVFGNLTSIFLNFAYRVGSPTPLLPLMVSRPMVSAVVSRSLLSSALVPYSPLSTALIPFTTLSRSFSSAVLFYSTPPPLGRVGAL